MKNPFRMLVALRNNFTELKSKIKILLLEKYNMAIKQAGFKIKKI